jgi:hypothetical protein
LLALSIIPLFVAAAMTPSMPDVQNGDHVENQDQEEGHNERDAAKPREDERAVPGAGRRRGNTNSVMESSE